MAARKESLSISAIGQRFGGYAARPACAGVNGPGQHILPRVRPLPVTAIAAWIALSLTACGKQGISVSKDDPNYLGAELFATHCAGCHTLSAAGTQGTGNRGLRTQGPNLDQRTETYKDALFAIQTGGFSGAIMPQNIVVGRQAEEVARFVAKYAGQQAQTTPRPGESGG
jgi:mono/diheme cytochrome c family protein